HPDPGPRDQDRHLAQEGGDRADPSDDGSRLLHRGERQVERPRAGGMSAAHRRLRVADWPRDQHGAGPRDARSSHRAARQDRRRAPRDHQEDEEQLRDASADRQADAADQGLSREAPMAGATRDVEIDARPETVFRIVTDYEAYPEFLDEIREAQILSRTERAV